MCADTHTQHAAPLGNNKKLEIFFSFSSSSSFFVVLQTHPVQLRNLSLGDHMLCQNQIMVGYKQVKHPSCYTISPSVSQVLQASRELLNAAWRVFLPLHHAAFPITSLGRICPRALMGDRQAPGCSLSLPVTGSEPRWNVGGLDGLGLPTLQELHTLSWGDPFGSVSLVSQKPKVLLEQPHFWASVSHLGRDS